MTDPLTKMLLEEQMKIDAKSGTFTLGDGLTRLLMQTWSNGND